MREASIKRPGSWGCSATVLAVPSKALGPLVSSSTFLGLFPLFKNALLLDCSPPGSSVHGISQTRILEWMPFPLHRYTFGRYFLLVCDFDAGRENPFHSLRAGSFLTLGNELSKETCAVKARDFIGKGCLGGGQEGEGS